MGETDIYELFGVEAPKAEGAAPQGGAGAKVTEPAAPSGAGDSAGAKAQEVAAPADGQGTGGQNPVDAAGAGSQTERKGDLPVPTGQQPMDGQIAGQGQGDRPAPAGHPSPEGNKGETQSPEENAAFAAARRKAEAERDAEIARVKEETAHYLDEAVKALGISNPYTGELITTRAQMDAYQAQMAKEQRERLQKKSGMSDQEFQGLIENLPEVRQAREAKAQADAALREVQVQRAQAVVAEQLGEISKLDPTIKTLDDILKLPNAAEFQEKVRRGYTFADAYKVLNVDRIVQAQAQAAKQAAVTAAQGKAHLSRTEQRGAGAESVPTEERALFRELMPDATEADIAAYYAKYKKG